jgi:SAM-dependent methyltransferase
MQAELIQRQYDQVIASNYDLDPKSLIGDSQDRALRQIQQHGLMADRDDPLRVLDLGIGTGKFVAKLRDVAAGEIEPFGVDVSEKMIAIAKKRLPDLTAVVDDAANCDSHFQDVTFDLIGTQFVTGFVPMRVLAPKIWSMLAPGGYWSFVGGTQAGFATLQQLARGKLLNWIFKGRTVNVSDVVYNPANEAEIARTLKGNDFEVCACATFEPELHFQNFSDFYAFAYLGGWLTPFIEALGLHRPRPVIAALLNAFVFPVDDCHNIVIALARKPLQGVIRSKLKG